MTDFSQEYLPPINHLVGGWGPWDQNISGTQPFSSQMGYDLYSNMAKPPVSDMDFWATPGHFSTSAAGNPDREQAAFAAWQKSPDWKLPGTSSGGFGNPSMPNIPGGFGTVNPMNAGPQYGGFGGGGGQSFLPPSSFGGGGAGGSLIGGGMDDVKNINDAKDAIKEMALALKNDFTPQIESATKLLSAGTTGPDINIPDFGSSGGGGGFGGGFGGYLGSGGGGGGAFAQRRYSGYEAGNPSFNEPESGGFGLRMPNLRFISRGMGAIHGAQQEMQSYMGQEAGQSMMLQSAGMISYGDMMGGQYGDIRRQQAAGTEYQMAMGKNVYNAYGGIANALMGSGAERSAFGAAAGIGQVAGGAALVGAGVGAMFGPLGAAAGGLLAGGAAAIVGAAGYATSAANDPYAIGSYLNSGDKMGDFQGAVGVGVQNLRYVAGTRTDAQNNMLRNAQNYTNNVNAFANGNMSTQDLKAWSSQNGYSPAQAISQGVDAFYKENTASFGWDSKQGGQESQTLALDLMLNPNKMPSTMPARLSLDPAANARNRMNGANLFTEQMSLGAGYAPFMQSFLPNAAGAMGVGVGDQGGMNGLMTMYTNRMSDIQNAGGNVSLYQQQLTSQINPIGKINQGRYRAGYGSVLGLDNYSGLSSDPFIQADVEGIDSQRYDYQASNPGFASKVSDPLMNRASFFSRSGRPDISGRLQGMAPTLQNWYDKAAAGGADISSSLLAYSTMAAYSPEMGQTGAAIASGDPLAISRAQVAGQLSDPRLRTVNPFTGMGAMTTSVDASQYKMLQQDQGGLFRLSADTVAGGTRGLEDQLRNMSRGMDQYQYQQATTSRNASYQLQTGGATQINSQGFAVSSDGLSELSSLFASQGVAFNKGNSMGMWQIEDSTTLMNRQKQQYGYDMQGQQMALSNQQFNESFNMNQQQFNLSSSYQSSQMSMSRAHQTTQESWTQQDMSLGKNKMELQYGWQQQDFDRDIRFARGRDRTNLMQQKERSTIMHGLDETQTANDETRFTQQKEWSKEEFDAKKSYFDQSKKLQQDEMNLTKKHHDESLALQQQQHEKEKGWMTEGWALEDQRRLLERQDQQLQYKMATDMAVAVKLTNESANKLNDGLTAMGRQSESNAGNLNVLNSTMGVFDQWVKQVTSSMGGTASGSAPSTSSSSATVPKAPASTSSSHVGGNAAITHQSGSPSDAHLADIKDILKQILSKGMGNVNATVYTNGSGTSKSLYQKSLSRVQ